MSLVESWASTVTRSNERLTQTPSSRSAVSARERRVGLRRSRASSRSAGGIMPAPLACARSRTVPPDSSTSSVDALERTVGGADRLGEVVAPSARSSRARAAQRLRRPRARRAARRSRRSRRPRPVLGRHAAGHRGGALHAGGVVRAARAGRGVRVAGVGDDGAHARRDPRALRQTCTGAAGALERVKRAALTSSPRRR